MYIAVNNNSEVNALRPQNLYEQIFTFLWSATKVLLQFRISFLQLFPPFFLVI
jgi:hypothetical protein